MYTHTQPHTHSIWLCLSLGHSGRTEILTALDDDAIARNCQLHGITVSCFVKIWRGSIELWDTSTPLGLMHDSLSLNVDKISKITTFKTGKAWEIRRHKPPVCTHRHMTLIKVGSGCSQILTASNYTEIVYKAIQNGSADARCKQNPFSSLEGRTMIDWKR